MITLESFAKLLEDRGQAALALASTLPLADRTLLHDLDILRKTYDPELAAAAVETTQLRRRAAAKFSRASEMYFTREALEQATAESVAQHRATRFHGVGEVWDLCCSVGGDLVQLASTGPVVGVDLDPLRLQMAQQNAAVYGVAQHITLQQQDVTDWKPPPGASIFCDPGRRTAGRRARTPEQYQPPLSTVAQWISRSSGIGVKVAPGIDYSALAWPLFEVEVVSLGGEVKEAVLWTGSLRRAERSATILPQNAILATTGEPVSIAVEPVRSYIYEPDGAVIRAHLVEQLAAELGATKIDAEIAFISTDHPVTTPFARGFQVREVLLWNLKRLRQRLRELDVGTVVVKKRGSPIDPQVLERQLRLQGAQHAVIIMTHMLDKPVAIICDTLD